MKDKIFEETFKKAFKELLDGKSVRQISEKYGFVRKDFIEECKKRFPENTIERKKLEQILSFNKANSATKETNEKELRTNIEKIINGELTLNEASDLMKLHKQTVNEKIVKYINESGDQELKQRFVEYQKRIHPDYSFINFKALTIEMIQKGLTQSEIAKQYGIPARTVSREIEKLKDDEIYLPLYEIAKEYSNRMMKRKKFETFENYLAEEIISSYNEKEVLIDTISKREKKYKELKEKLEKAEEVDGTQAQKAKAIRVSVSTLRRMKKQIEKYEMEERKKLKKIYEGE